MKKRIRSSLKRILLYGLLFIVLAFSALFIYIDLNQERIETELLEEFNKMQSGHLNYNDLDVSAFTDFPRISLVLSGLNYYASDDTTTAPIVQANTFSVMPDIIKLIRGEVSIESVKVRGGHIILSKRKNGSVNISEALRKPKKEARDSTRNQKHAEINIQNIEILDTSFDFDFLDQEVNIHADIENLNGSLFQPEGSGELEIEMTSVVNNVRYLDIRAIRPLNLQVGTKILTKPLNNQLFVDQADLKLDDVSIKVNSDTDENKMPYLVFKSDLTLASFQALLSKLSLIEEALTVSQGDLQLNGELMHLKKGEKPLMRVDVDLKNAQINDPNANSIAMDLKGQVAYESLRKEWSIQADNLSGTINGDSISGQLTYAFDAREHYRGSTDLSIHIVPDQEKEQLKGRLAVNSNFSYAISPNRTLTFDSLTSIKASLEEVNYRGHQFSDMSFELDGAGDLIRLVARTLQSEANNLSVEGELGPFERKGMFPDLNNIPFDLEADLREAKFDSLELGVIELFDKFLVNVEGDFKRSERDTRLSVESLDLQASTSQNDHLTLTGQVQLVSNSISTSWMSDELALNSKSSELILNELMYESSPESDSVGFQMATKQFNLSDLTPFSASKSALNALDTFSLATSLNVGAVLTSDSLLTLSLDGSLKANSATQAYAVDHLKMDLDGVLNYEIERVRGKVELEQMSFNSDLAFSLGLDVGFDRPELELDLNAFDNPFEGQGKLQWTSITDQNAPITFNYAVNDMDLQKFWSQFTENEFIKGRVGVSMNLQTYANHWLDSLSGSTVIKGENWEMFGFDMDEVLSDYQKSQHFRLKDMGAFMLMGPFGPVLSKGADFARLATIDTTDVTEVSAFNAAWQVKGGSLLANDVAFSTKQNRIATKGTIDLSQQEFDSFKLAVLDQKGCSILEEEVNGAFNNPDLSDISVVGTLLGSVINVFKIVSDKDCVPFYTGIIQHPEKDR